MASPSRDKIKELLVRLIVQGEQLASKVNRNTVFAPQIEAPEVPMLRRWANELTLFKSLAGDLIKPWDETLHHNGEVLLGSALDRALSILHTIKFAADSGLLGRYEDLITAGVFADLNEQGQHLLNENYYLAAGVIFRAVLEEKLRKLCKEQGCVPGKQRPTINDFNQALYVSKFYDKNMMLNVQALAGIGNTAAHNESTLTIADVERLKNGVQELLTRFSA